MPGPSSDVLRNRILGWLVPIVGTVLVAGVLGMARQQFYTKPEVDAKLDAHSEQVEGEFEHHREVQKLQNEMVLQKLDGIKEDVEEIKEAANGLR